MKTSMIRVPCGAKRKLAKFREAAEEGGTVDQILDRAGLRRRDLKIVEQANMCYKVTCLDALDLNAI